MPLFQIEAVDRKGTRYRERREAESQAALKDALRREGFIPLSIEPYTPGGFNPFRRITTKDLLVFTQELGGLLEAGLPLDRAILVLARHNEKERMREVLNDVYRALQKGQSLSDALRAQKIFPRLYVNMVKAGEAGGILEPVLRRLASFIQTTTEFKEEMTSALIYPILLTLVGSSAIAVLMLYVIPKFATIFEEMGQALPLPTEILLGVSTVVSRYWWVVVLLITIGAILARRYLKTEEGRVFLDRMLLRVPLVRGLQMRIYIARFARTMGTLLKSGVPILSAIRISREVVGNQVISQRLETLEEGVRKGRGVSGPLRESGVFPEVVLQMVSVGEEAGRLEETFVQIAERFESESRSTIKRLISFIEPALILLMGIVVGFIVISMLLAIFSVNEIPL
ncbi:MAG: type II secretion system F family protein [Nitrospirae bacterium]|nr:MAG: type II secretion system F family protein [Nitrospirota bacterium]